MTFGLLLTLQGCGLDVEDPTPPSPPVWVEKSFPAEWPEKGIDADKTSVIVLQWEQEDDEPIFSYQLYRAIYHDANDSLGDFGFHAEVNVESESIGEFRDSDLDIGVRYFYKIRSIDQAENFSVFSDSISYALLPRILSDMMTPNGPTTSLLIGRELRWHNFYTNDTEDYCLTMINIDEELILREQIQPQNYFSGVETWVIPTSIALDSNTVYKWRVDVNARYVDGKETYGSESPWATFTYLGD